MHVCRRWATSPASLVTTFSMHHELKRNTLQMHLRNRSGVMHKRWLFKHARMHVHTSMPTKHCRPSYNATKTMNTFTCDPHIQQATLCNDSTLLYIRTSLVDDQWHNGKTLFSFCSHKKTGSCDAKLPTHNTKHDVVNHRSGQTADT